MSTLVESCPSGGADAFLDDYAGKDLSVICARGISRSVGKNFGLQRGAFTEAPTLASGTHGPRFTDTTKVDGPLSDHTWTYISK